MGFRGDLVGSVASCPGLRVQYWKLWSKKARRTITKKLLFRSFASASRPLNGAKQKGNRRSNACVGGRGANHDVLFQDDVEHGGQECAQKWADPVLLKLSTCGVSIAVFINRFNPCGERCGLRGFSVSPPALLRNSIFFSRVRPRERKKKRNRYDGESRRAENGRG